MVYITHYARLGGPELERATVKNVVFLRRHSSSRVKDTPAGCLIYLIESILTSKYGWRFYFLCGDGIPRSLQILRTSGLNISIWRGRVEV